MIRGEGGGEFPPLSPHSAIEPHLAASINPERAFAAISAAVM